MPVIAAYMAGLAVARPLDGHAVSVAAVLALVFLGAAFFSVRRRDPTLVLLAVLFAAGCLRVNSHAAERIAAYTTAEALSHRVMRTGRGIVDTTTEELTADRHSLTLRHTVVTSGSRTVVLPGRVLLHVSGKTLGGRIFVPGTPVEFRGAVMVPPALHNFGIPGYRHRLAAERIYAIVRVGDAGILREVHGDAQRAAAESRLDRVRRRVTNALVTVMGDTPGRMAASMLLNDKRLLTDRQLENLRDSNLLHLFVVSGLHVAIVAGIVLTILSATAMPRRVSWLLALVLVAVYVWMLGWPAPAVRALLMFAAYALGVAAGREIDHISSLLAAAGLMLIVEPMLLFQPTFILSFTCVMSLILLGPLFYLWFHGTQERPGPDTTAFRATAGVASGTLAIAIGLLPLQIYLFQQYNLLGIPANIAAGLLSLPVVALSLGASVVGMVSTALGQWLGHGAAATMELLYGLAVVTASQEWAIYRPPRPPLLLILFVYGILLSGYYLVRRDTPEFRPKSISRFTIHALLAFGILLAWPVVRPFKGTLKIWFLDVAQGDSTIIEFPNGQSLIVDAGHQRPDMGRLVTAPTMKILGIRRADYLLATHDDIDHIGGMTHLVQGRRTSNLAEPLGLVRVTSTLEQVRKSVIEAGGKVMPLARGMKFDAGGGCEVEVLNPGQGLGEQLSDNELSVVLLLRFGEFSALLTGDAGAVVEESLVALGIGEVDVLKAGHHGSRSSSTVPFLEKIRPKIAIVSCGARNVYGHPHPGVLRNLRSVGAQVWRTDQHGAVCIETNGSDIRITHARADAPTPAAEWK